MRWHCSRPHHYVSGTSGYSLRRMEGQDFKTFHGFLLDWIFHRPALTTKLLRIGFVDALTDGGDAFLRWDFWNAIHAKAMREHARAGA